MPQEPRLTRDHVVWAYRILLDRDPENEGVIVPKLAGYRTTQELRSDMVTSQEYRDKNRDFAQSNDRNIVIKELDGGLRLFVDLADHAIGLNIIRGRFEPAEVDFVRGHLRPGQNAVDAGAHIGFFTMHMAQSVGREGHVHAFEPFGPNADLLERSIAENAFTERVTLERAALGRETGWGSLAFATHTLNSGGAFLVGAGPAPGGHAVERVRTIALDQYPLRRPIAMIKMDVEGAEPLLLQGAARLIREDQPVIMTEVHGGQLTRVSASSAGAFFADVRAMGYAAHAIESGRLSPPLTQFPEATVAQVALLPRQSGQKL